MVDEGLGENDQPAIAVFTKAVEKYKNNPGFKQKLMKIEEHYAKSTYIITQSTTDINKNSKRIKLHNNK